MSEFKETVSGVSVMTRRKMLGLSAAVVLTTLGCTADNVSDLLSDQAEKSERLDVLPFNFNQGVVEPFNLAYLQSLFTELQRDRGNRRSRTTAVRENAWAIVAKINNQTAIASALKIDEAGYFLAAAHTFHEQGQPLPSAPFLYNPRNGQAAFVRSIIMDTDQDIALAYASLGRPKKAVSNLQIKREVSASTGNVWAMGLSSTGTSSKIDLVTLRGLVKEQGPNNMLRVEGMQPLGGLSGGPVVDSEGRVIAILQGSLRPAGLPLSRGSSIAGVISPVNGILNLAGRNIYNYQ